jgi:hypothetical protein
MTMLSVAGILSLVVIFALTSLQFVAAHQKAEAGEAAAGRFNLTVAAGLIAVAVVIAFSI